MSLEVLLIPLGLAAAAAWREARSSELCSKCRSTKITDAELLRRALAEMGAANIEARDGRLHAHTALGDLTFARVGDSFVGRVDGGRDEDTIEMLTALEAAAGRVAQRETVEQLRERAREMGMRLLSESTEDGNVRLVFEQA